MNRRSGLEQQDRLASLLAGLSPPTAPRRRLAEDTGRAGEYDRSETDESLGLAQKVSFEPDEPRPDRHLIGDLDGTNHKSGWSPRFQLTRTHITAIAAICTLILAVALIKTLAARGHQIGEVQASPLAVPMTPTESPTRQEVVVVHVTGAVQHPGVVELPGGARVIDAIEACGGLTPEADSALLNMAAKVPDGAQIVVGTQQAPAGEVKVDGAMSDPGDSALVNLNTADATTLESLPDVGPVTAAAIIAFRDANGGFTAVDQLRQVDGIGEKTFAKLAPLVTV